MQSNGPVAKLGFGLGLRPQHYPYIFDHAPAVDWFEIISENFMDTHGRPRRNLARIKEKYPIVMHGVALSIGTVDPLNSEYLQKLKALAGWVKPAWISDHLCWTGVAHRNTHDLLPVPYTEEALKHITARIRQVQDYLEQPIALENPSTYLEFKSSTMPEAEFIARMAQDSGCLLLLDVNNVYVTCYNHRLDPKTYIDTLPLDRVAQIHLSGHSHMGTHIIDTHDNPVIDEVWALYGYVVNKAGRTPNTMVEWDDHIPEFPVLFAELDKARLAAAGAAQHPTLPDLAQANERIPIISADMKNQQALMQDAILQGPNFNSDPEAWIYAKNGFAPADQLSVYVNAYRYRLYDTTAEDFPVLKHYLGDDAFDKLMTDFVNTVPSEHFNISRYAARLPEFMAAQSDKDAFAYDIAVLENAVSQLMDPVETDAWVPEDLAGLTPELLMRSYLQPRAALQLFAFDGRVNDYYRAVMELGTTPTPIQGKSAVAVFRHDATVWRMDLEPEEYHLLQKLFSDMTVGDALAAVEKENKTVQPEQLSAWFARWLRNGLLRRPEIPFDQPQKRAS